MVKKLQPVKKKILKGPRIHILDVTNRDGVQTSRLGLAKLQKTMINLYLDKMGVYQSEMGFPFTNHEISYINANLELKKIGAFKSLILSGWCRPVIKDIEKSLKLTNIKDMNISVSTSKQMLDSKFGGKYSKDDIIRMISEATKYAKKSGVKTIGVNAEDASRSDVDFLIDFAIAAKEAGADRFRYCDTLGYDDPFSIYERISKIVASVKIGVELHCHNDLGMAVAVSIGGAKAAVDSGVDAYINTTVNGMGERAGNADLVSTILAIKKASGLKGKYAMDDNIDLKMAWKISKYASYAFGVPIPINQPGVGDNAFAHESGIHVDGALKDSRNYELYHYKELGRGEPEIIETGRQITVGEYSGIKGFGNVYGKMEIEFKNDEEATKILELVRYANVHTQKPLVEDELRFIASYPEMAKQIMTVTPP
ncbi:MAG: homocitrate synthase [Candidatus Omnitrophica bacterium]|nr:homocitrate synthase [Candidatus Omnitrophota bacterium]MBU1047824.1 homocitrate synthase [Candidatus Omnitrophota bacterium]MBU1631105.1 homocitrate synthase [Candidatus Omnitrophota bacterium]MBU1767549.1 homocitrate synthase [Candidatus Omnitrophota bacterium]MBU1889211.1 homocitrate synthase [Candidatus Omnitrophota bacterium]